MKRENCILIGISIIFVYFGGSHSVDVSNCGSYFTFDNIYLEGCSDADEACRLYNGTTVSITFEIDTGEYNIDGDLMNDVAIVIQLGMKLAIVVTPVNPCDVLVCPLDVNYRATYAAEVLVTSTLPPLRGDLRWVLMTAAQEQLMCFQFPVTVNY